MKKFTIIFILLTLSSCASLELHDKITFEFTDSPSLKDGIEKASTLEQKYIDTSRQNYKDLVTLDQFLLHSALVGVIGVASSAHTDVLTTAGIFGGYIGAQKAYAGPLGKAKLYLEGASAAQCVQRHTGQLIPFVTELQDEFDIAAIKLDLKTALTKLRKLDNQIENHRKTLTGKDLTDFDARLNTMSLGDFDSLKGVLTYGEERLEDIKDTITEVDNLPYMVMRKLQEIDMEVTRRFITETVDINTVIATLKEIQVTPPEAPKEEVEEDVTVDDADNQKIAKAIDPAAAGKANTDLSDAVEEAKNILLLSNQFTSKDLTLLSTSTAAIKACVVATVQATD
jgi:hypothetical protein